jgi:hypothetical protein
MGKKKTGEPTDVFIFENGTFQAPNEPDGRYKFDNSKDPYELDLSVPMGTIKAVAEFKGDDLLFIAFGPPDKTGKPGPRPKELANKENVLLVLKRGNKEDAKFAGFSSGQSRNNLKQLALATINFADTNRGAMPTAASYDAAGKPLLSWRVAILPYIEQLDLYKEFDLTKPWDDPVNKKLIPKMPKVYVVPGTDAKAGKTHYRVLVKDNTPFEPARPNGKPVGRKYPRDFTDGVSNVILFVEAKEPIEWTRPDEIPLDPKGPLPKFGVAPSGFNVAFADGRAQFISSKVPEAVLRPYFTLNNGQPRQRLDGKEDKDDIKEKRPDPKDKDFKDEKKEVVNPRQEEARRVVAKAQLEVLTKAAQAYAARNDAKFPLTLADLLQKDATGAGPYLQGEQALLDPWKKPYQYDPTGPKNDGKKPDIWTVAPDKQIIGNWAVKKFEEPKEEIKKEPDPKGLPGKGPKLPGKLTSLPDQAHAFVIAVAQDKPAWKVPGAWKELDTKSPITLATFVIDTKDKSAKVTVTPLSGQAGGLLANVNRWRAQLKAGAWSEEEFKKAAKKVKVGGSEGVYVEITNANAEATFGVIVVREESTWFFKLTGDATIVNREKDNFLKFLNSVKFK